MIFDNFSIPEIKKDFIDVFMRNCSRTFKNAVFQRLIRYKKGEDYWADEGNFTKSAQELVAIWKMARIAVKGTIYDELSVVEYAQERLEALETELKEGNINEQRYIEKCNWIKFVKERDEKLLSGCACNVIGNIDDDDDDLEIICLPCDWDKDAVIVRF